MSDKRFRGPLDVLWRFRPPVSPWWMYRWLRDWAPHRRRLRAAWHTLPCWFALWRWAVTPAGYWRSDAVGVEGA